MLENGTLVDGKYEILSKVGQGGMSVVYLALNRKAMKQWAIKEVRRDGVKDFEVVKQSLVAETDMLKKLSHPNLPDIVDIIETDDSFLIVMDYIEGKPLSKRLEESGAQPEEYVVEWAKQLCDVLDYLHTRQPAIIYRDMKPSNVMLKPDGSVCLIDFGTAREYKGTNIQDTTCLGTIGYAAPEQFGGHGETDARTDIYCLGATLYHLVTGHSPAEPPYEMRPIREWDESLSPGLEAIILKCIQKNPNDRYQSCAELKYALENMEENTRVYWVQQRKKLKRFIASAVATFVCLAVGLTGTILGNAASKSQYDSYIAKANNETGADAINDYRSAFGTKYMGDDPENLYTSFVNYMQAYIDNDETKTITSDEIKAFKSDLGTADSSNEDKYIDVIRRDDDSNVLMNYEIGIKVLLHSEGSEVVQYNAAKSWFVNAYNDENGKKIDAASLDSQKARDDAELAEIFDNMIKCYTDIRSINDEDDIITEGKDYVEVYTAIETAVDSVSNDAIDDGVKLKIYEVLSNFLADHSIVAKYKNNNPDSGKALSKWNEVVGNLNKMNNLTGSKKDLKDKILEQNEIIQTNFSVE